MQPVVHEAHRHPPTHTAQVKNNDVTGGGPLSAVFIHDFWYIDYGIAQRGAVVFKPYLPGCIVCLKSCL